MLSTGRQDWGILRSVVLQLAAESDFELTLLWAGTHALEGTEPDLVPGSNVRIDRIDWIGSDGPRIDPVEHAARALASVGRSLAEHESDALMVVGDRFETAAAALAATLVNVPIVHLHGGEETLGAIDNAMRHAITKLSHLHLVSHEDHRARVIAMGEDPTTVRVVGAPGLDNGLRDDLPSRAELETILGLTLDPPVVIVTVHPTTLSTDPAREARLISQAMDKVPATYVITLPNLDPGASDVRQIMLEHGELPRRVVVSALGARAYWGLMKVADAMVGNSSSGLIEAPVVPLPVVNVGERQAGRPRSAGIIDVPSDLDSITSALRTALSPRFRAQLDNPAVQPVALAVATALREWTPPQPPVKARIDVSRRS